MIESIFLQLDRLQRGDLSAHDIELLKTRIEARADSGKLSLDVYKDLLEFINNTEETKDE